MEDAAPLIKFPNQIGNDFELNGILKDTFKREIGEKQKESSLSGKSARR